MLNWMENGNCLVLLPLTRWRTNRNIISVKQAFLKVPQYQGASVSLYSGFPFCREIREKLGKCDHVFQSGKNQGI